MPWVLRGTQHEIGWVAETTAEQISEEYEGERAALTFVATRHLQALQQHSDARMAAFGPPQSPILSYGSIHSRVTRVRRLRFYLFESAQILDDVKESRGTTAGAGRRQSVHKTPHQ